MIRETERDLLVHSHKLTVKWGFTEMKRKGQLSRLRLRVKRRGKGTGRKREGGGGGTLFDYRIV